MEDNIEPVFNGDNVTRKWIKESLGPDAFLVQVEGAERRVEEVPSRYLGGCEYEFGFELRNAGRVWISAELLFEASFPSFLTCAVPDPTASLHRAMEVSKN
jgi:hypothetical protein